MHSQDIYKAWSISRIHTNWACFVSQDYRLCDQSFHKEALGFALQIMSKVRECLLRIIDQLDKENYRFIDNTRVIKEPDPNASEWISHYRKHGVYIPLAFEAWLKVVGSINLMGTHPEWSKSAYAFDDVITTEELLYTDPLVVELTEDYMNYLYTEWQESTNSQTAILCPPFRLELSPDHLHKANISGGLPYELSTNRLAVDSLLLNERHCTSFLGYIRHVISWGGFPGFDYIRGADKEQCKILLTFDI